MAFRIKQRSQYEDCFCGRIATPPPEHAIVVDDNVTSCITGPKKRVGKGDYGGHILLCGKKESYFPFHCMVGPDWPVVVIVYALVIGIDIIVLPVIAALGWPVLMIGLIGFFGTLISYSAVACSDPGIVYHPESAAILLRTENCNPMDGSEKLSNDLESGPLVANMEQQESSVINVVDTPSEPDSQVLLPIDNSNAIHESGELPPISTIGIVKESTAVVPSMGSAPLHINGVSISNTIECGQCQINRPKTARHCTYCGVCVEHLDHHCPWCGKCIGKKNIVAFNVFVSFVCFQIYFLGGSLLYYIVSLFTKWPHGPKA